jgi:hypothetical protein
MDEPAAPIADVIGWKTTDDKTHALIKFKQAAGDEFAIALPHHMLMKTITTAVDALAAFPQPKMSSGVKATIETEWFEVGKTPVGDLWSVTFRTKGGGSLTFAMDKQMAERLAETLAVVVGTVAIAPTPGTTRN